MKILSMQYVAQDYIDALLTMEHATRYLESQFVASLPRAEASANICARALLAFHRQSLLVHTQTIFMRESLHANEKEVTVGSY